MKQLTNFGELLRFSIDMEADHAEFYTAQAEASPLFSDLAKAHQRRHDQLRIVRQENLNEMLLEPLCGLAGPDPTVPGASTEDATQRALALEQQAEAYYHDVAVKAKSALGGAARTFRRFGEQNAEFRRRLEP
jgi:rubrerythrin